MQSNVNLTSFSVVIGWMIDLIVSEIYPLTTVFSTIFGFFSNYVEIEGQMHEIRTLDRIRCDPDFDLPEIFV